MTVASAVFVTVLAMLLAALTSLMNNSNRGQALTNNSDEVRNIAQQVTKEVRGAASFLSQDTSTSRYISGTELLLLTSAAAGPQNVISWNYDATTNVLTRCSRLYSGGTFGCTPMLRNVNVNRTGSIFRYFCGSGAELNPANTNGPSDIQTAGVRARVSLEAAPNAGPAPIPFEEDADIRVKLGDQAC
jgi:hypothetical protein